jgi:hypothetical protein
VRVSAYVAERLCRRLSLSVASAKNVTRANGVERRTKPPIVHARAVRVEGKRSKRHFMACRCSVEVAGSGDFESGAST